MTNILISKLVTSSGVKFGTSGMRGLVSDISDKVTWCYTMAFLQFLEQKHGIVKSSKIAIACDLRDSSPRITAVIISAVTDAGFTPILCGEIPTPAVSLYGITNNIPSIMVTGSHIPDDRNGIKFNTPVGELMKSDEPFILSQIVNYDGTKFDENGNLIVEIMPQHVDTVAYDMYINRYLEFFPASCLSGKNIALYEHSSVASIVIRKILGELGANVISLGYSKKFISVDTEAIRKEDVMLAKRWSNEYELDSIVSTDGDGDRPLISDENGVWLKGDVVGVLTAKYLGIKSIVTPVSSNTVLEKSNLFGNIVRTKIGSPYVIEQMNSLLDSGETSVAGYEANGGVMLASDVGCLKALPTRDAVIAILSVIMLSVSENKQISTLVSELPPRYTESSKIDDFPNKLSTQILESIQNIESDTTNQIVSKYYDTEISITDVNLVDGVRITLSNNDVMHFRSSGNAPEFRVYSESDSYESSKLLNEYCNQFFSGFLV